MGLFKRRTEKQKLLTVDEEWQFLRERDMSMRGVELVSLLETTGGDYVRRGPAWMVKAATAQWARIGVEAGADWEGVAWLYRTVEDGHRVVAVAIRGVTVTYLTKESVETIWDRLEDGLAIPVRCTAMTFKSGMPSLMLWSELPKPEAQPDRSRI